MLTRTQLEICVTYTAPATQCRRVLRVLPLQRAGQNVVKEAWKTLPEADYHLEKSDALGNRRLLLRHRHIEREFRFGLEIEVETNGQPIPEAKPDFGRWKMPSRAVVLTPEFQEISREFKSSPPLERAAALAGLCFEKLKYQSLTSSTPGKSSNIWLSKRGSCADFAHVFLSLCRSSGLVARYVAGYNASQGQMHAWAEIWCEGAWHAFDPTLGQAASPGNVAVAVGRDFYDCQPHTGSFRGEGYAGLKLWCHTQKSEMAGP